MKETSLLLKLTSEIPLFKIIDFLVENKGMEFTKKELIEGCQISRATFFNYWQTIEAYCIVKVTRKFGKTKLYTLDASNIIVKKVLDLEKALISNALEKENKELIIDS